MGAGAMVQYLLEKFSDGALNVPGGTQQRADFLQVRILLLLPAAALHICLICIIRHGHVMINPNHRLLH